MKLPRPLANAATTIMLTFLSLPVFSYPDAEERFLKGYVVTTKKDTLHGWILLKDHSFNTRTCAFRASADAPMQSFTPDDLIGYSIEDKKHFISRQISNDRSIVELFTGGKVFLESLVEGTVGLYVFQERYFIKTRDAFEELILSTRKITSEGKVFVIRDPLYKLTLRKAMGDCRAIDQHLEKTAFTKKDLTKLFIAYHDCTGNSPILYDLSEDQEKIKTGYSLLAGAYFSVMRIDPKGTPDYHQFIKRTDASWSRSFIPSFYIHLLRPAMTTRRELKIGLSMYSGKYEFSGTSSASNLAYNLKMESVTIEVPILMKNYVVRNKSGVYLQGGIGINTLAAWKDKLTVKVASSSSLLRESEKLNPNTVGVDLLGGPGFEFPLFGKTFVVECFYTYKPMILKGSTKSPSAKVNAFTFNGGVRF